MKVPRKDEEALLKPEQGVHRIEYLRVQNYRALRDLELKDLTPLTVFLGPNGSGKSTVFDVFAFLSECFSVGLRKACLVYDRAGGASTACAAVPSSSAPSRASMP